MDYIWNDNEFPAPPVNTYKSSDISIDVPKLHTIISDAIYFLENQKMLHREAAIISRLIYFMGRKFRHDIGYSYMRRTNIALLKYLNLNLINDLKIFLSVVPTFVSINVYLPTCQMLEYVLVRLQTFGHIMCRIVICARKSATFFFERLKRGDSAWISLTPYTVLSRIWLLSDRLLKNCCKWYNNILPFKSKLKIVGVSILPSGYSFPVNLFSWLEVDCLDKRFELLWKSGSSHSSNYNIQSFFSDILKSQYLENDNSMDVDIPTDQKTDNQREAEYADNLEESSKRSKYIPSNIVVKKNTEDIGEIISRHDFQNVHENQCATDQTNSKLLNIHKNIKSKQHFQNNLSPKNIHLDRCTNDITTPKLPSHISHLDLPDKANTANRYIHSIDSIVCVKSLKKFIENEDVFRLNNEKCSITSHIGFIQWESLKKILRKKVEKLGNKHKLNGKRVSKMVTKIFTERC